MKSFLAFKVISTWIFVYFQKGFTMKLLLLLLLLLLLIVVSSSSSSSIYLFAIICAPQCISFISFFFLFSHYFP